MKILVTGASGFIGRHLVEAVAARGLEPYPMVRGPTRAAGLERWGPNIRFAVLDDDRSLVAAVEGMDVVVHLAGLTRAPTEDAFRAVNAEGVARLVRACHRAHRPPERFVLVSSLAAGGPSAPGVPRREDERAAPVSAYGRSKLAGEETLRREALGISWTVVRPPIVYGPHDRDMLALFRLARRGLVPLAGSPESRFSIVFGADLARMVVDLVRLPAAASAIIHVAEATAYTSEEMVGHVAAAVGTRPRVVRLPPAAVRLAAAAGSLAGRITRRPRFLNLLKLPEILAPGWECATDRLTSLLGGAAPTSLADGARATAAWYREQGWL